ncbi:MAG TPA: MG2 domain-containing protein, partial [Bryobacteraceae bacterium]|nr:MG2 domain-containing protein [Bryobacteraceae bacterium]
MIAPHLPRKSFGLWLLLAAALFGIASLAILEPFQDGVPRGGGDTATAVYSHSTLQTVIPYRAPRPGAGRLIVDVLDPDDKVLGQIDGHVTVNSGKGRWRESVKLAKSLSVDELVWHRLRHRFTYDGETAPTLEDTESISTILRMPVVRILGQQSYLSGGQAAVRVIVTDSKNEFIPGPSAVRIELPGPNPRVLFTGRLNSRGTTEAQFQMPPGLVGTFPLRYIADTPIGTAEFTEQVRLEDKVSVLLTTEKPIYQPGQSIHARALALDRANHAAAAARKLTFEVEDSRGNKVFKKATQTDKFGIASAEFDLADEVNLGTYHLRVRLGDDDSANTAELALNVERYVLPKFKVAVDFAGDGKPAKLFYRPGDHVTGTVRANYFFGKPVDRAEVSIKASGMDVAQFEAVSAQGKTDDEGAWRFDLKLPEYFAGRPLSHGTAAVLIEATVKDSAGHAETRGAP